MLDWADLTYAMAMLGLNSSVTPLTAVPQGLRPFPYQNGQARRLLNLGQASAAALAALRKTIPWQLAANSRPEKPAGELVYEFMLDNPAAGFMGAALPSPRSRRRRPGRGRAPRARVALGRREGEGGPHARVAARTTPIVEAIAPRADPGGR